MSFITLIGSAPWIASTTRCSQTGKAYASSQLQGRRRLDCGAIRANSVEEGEYDSWQKNRKGDVFDRNKAEQVVNGAIDRSHWIHSVYFSRILSC